MIIQCQSCSRKFIVKDADIPSKGRMVQCGYCSEKWFQNPIRKQARIKTQNTIASNLNNDTSAPQLKASDGKTYRFLGKQWAEILQSGKTGILAKKNISKELNEIIEKTENNSKPRVIDPSSENTIAEPSKKSRQLPDIYEPKHGLGFFGYIFLLIIVSLSIIGILKTFENELLMYFPESEYIYETMNNINTIIMDLINSY